MNWETFKSLLLTVLVVLSLFLTWNLWNYQSDYQKVEDTSYVNSTISEKRSLSEVVRPFQVIFHKKGNDYGMTSMSDLKDMFRSVTKAEYKQVNEIKNKQKGDPPKTNAIELIFPEAIPILLFGDMVHKSSDDQTRGVMGFSALDSDLEFDRIVFYKTDIKSANMKAHFNNEDSPVATAYVSGLSFDDLDQYQDKNSALVASNKLGNNHNVYLPKNKVGIPEVYYSYSWIPVEQFKVALFSDPHNVLRQGDYFTSGINLLKESEHTIKYVNSDPGTGHQKNTEPVDSKTIIQQSFDYINGHSGWTDQYVFFDYVRHTGGLDEPLREEVTFRLMINSGQKGYPVFTDNVYGNYPYQDAGTILLNWSSSNVHEYARTLIDIKARIEEKNPSWLPSGSEIIQKLKTSDNIEWGKVRDLRIGFDMEYPPKPNAVVFTPNWFVLYGEKSRAEWKKVYKLTEPKEEVPEHAPKGVSP